MSAAFDTLNHYILISRLHEEAGVSGLALEWFISYPQNRTQRVAVNGTFSERFVLGHGVSQGSCLGPLLFIIYSSKLFKVIRISFYMNTSTQTIHNYISVLSRIGVRRRLLLLMLWSVAWKK